MSSLVLSSYSGNAGRTEEEKMAATQAQHDTLKKGIRWGPTAPM